MRNAIEVAKLNRDIDDLNDAVTASLRTRMTDADRRALRSEIEICMQRLDELRARLGG